VNRILSGRRWTPRRPGLASGQAGAAALPGCGPSRRRAHAWPWRPAGGRTTGRWLPDAAGEPSAGARAPPGTTGAGRSGTRRAGHSRRTRRAGAWKSRAMEAKQRSGSYHTTTRFSSRSCWILARTKELTDTASPIRRGYFKAGHPPGGGAFRQARLLPSRGGDVSLRGPGPGGRPGRGEAARLQRSLCGSRGRSPVPAGEGPGVRD